MDMCVRITVAVALAGDIVTGRSYHTAHDCFHHDFEHERTPPRRSPVGHPPEHKQFWRFQPHSQNRQTQWQSRGRNHPPELSGADQRDFWAYQQGNTRPNNWPHSGPHDWSNGDKPDHWPHGHPSNLYDQERPGWNNNRPTGNQGSTVTNRDSATSSSQNTLVINQCIRSCPVTPEYNPVCGSNNVTYGNPGRLECAKYCGVDVSLTRDSPCPPNNTTPNETTASPLQPQRTTLLPITPTRFTTINLPASTNKPPPVTISQDILNSIFSTASTTIDDNYDIDIRTRSRFPSPPLQYVYPIPKQ